MGDISTEKTTFDGGPQTFTQPVDAGSTGLVTHEEGVTVHFAGPLATTDAVEETATTKVVKPAPKSHPKPAGKPAETK